ncbi:MAG: hypothetical protein RBT69_10020 [Spirochaetia bacterium]|jgi:hypothetical protein|nr:hypothetical protein [Spirochaetia bacterium]
MGLLEKIINQQIQSDKDIEYSKQQSLLKKAEFFLSGEYAPDKKKNQTIIETEVTRLKKKNKGLSAPFEIYNFFIDYFGIKKGALLVRDSNTDFFTTWSVSGYDYTTTNRMNIPSNEVFELISSNMMIEEKAFILKSKSLYTFEKYFSSREFANIESALIIPFFTTDEKPFAFLFFSDLFYLDKNYSNIMNYISLFYQPFKKLLFDFYKNVRLKPDSSFFIPRKSVYNSIMKIASENEGYSNYFVALFDTNNFVASLKEEYNSSFHNNLIRLFSSFILNSGKILILDDNMICLVKDAPSLNDKQLFAYQILLVIENMIPGKKLDSTNLITVFHLPADNDLMKDFLNA